MGEEPAEADYPVQVSGRGGWMGGGASIPAHTRPSCRCQQVHYFSPSGSCKALGSSDALLGALRARLLEGRTLCWSRGTAGDSFLCAAAELLGASCTDVPGSAPNAMPATGAVVVRASEDEQPPAAYARLPWTTPDRLVGGLLEGSLEGVVQQPAATPSSAAKGRHSSKAGAKNRPATGIKQCRTAAVPQQQGCDSVASMGAALEREPTMHAAPEPLMDRGVMAGRKRRHKQEEQQQQQEAEGQQTEQTPAKRQRRGRAKTSLLLAGEMAASPTPVAEVSIMPSPPPQALTHKPLPELPASEGWHAIKHGRAARVAAAAAMLPPLPSPAQDDSTGPTKTGAWNSGKAQVQLVEEEAEQIETFDCNLVVVTDAPGLPPLSAPSGSGDMPNYKAFRPKCGGAVPPPTPAELVRLTGIYEEAVDAGSVHREENKRRMKLSEADQLFAADL